MQSNKLDLVYILGGGSRWENNEIRYSIRSAEIYYKNLGKIFIIGECPEWFQNVIHIKVPDKNSNKLLNARDKYLAAANDPRVSNNFVLMNDDFFFLKPADEIKNYSRGKLSEMIAKHSTKDGYYYHSLRDTMKRLDGMGIPNATDFEVHAPIVLNKEKLLTTIKLIGTDHVYSIRSCYGNLMGLKPTKVMDYKAANLLEWAIQKRRKNAPFLSINDSLVADDDFRTWIHMQYPNMSSYELYEDGLLAKPGRPVSARVFYATKNFMFRGYQIYKGNIIAKEVVDEIKNIRAMRDVWELK